MASLQAYKQANNSSLGQIPVDSLPLLLNGIHSDKWNYLVANHIRFSNKQVKSIRITKPQQSLLNTWLEKIITSGQCATLFVEQLSVDKVTLKRLNQLCVQYHVTLINLTLADDNQNNVIQGPW